MPIVVSNCKRCLTKNTTFDCYHANFLGTPNYSWQSVYEFCSVCRHCKKSSILLGKQTENNNSMHYMDNVKGLSSINSQFEIFGSISIKDEASLEKPELLPQTIESVFNEAVTCLAVQCWNAAGAMFRQCLDLATKDVLVQKEGAESSNIKLLLKKRLEYIFSKDYLSKELQDLADCIREDGNDAAHDGTLEENDALDLYEFTFEVLEKVYTTPQKIINAKDRRVERRSSKPTQ